MAKIINNKWYTDEEYDREDMGIFVYNVADSKYEEVDVRRCKWHV